MNSSETQLSIKDAAAYLGVHRDTLKNWEDHGQLLFAVERTGGGHRRYPLAGLERQAEYLRTHAGQPPEMPASESSAIHQRLAENKRAVHDLELELDHLLDEHADELRIALRDMRARMALRMIFTLTIPAVCLALPVLIGAKLGYLDITLAIAFMVALPLTFFLSPLGLFCALLLPARAVACVSWMISERKCEPTMGNIRSQLYWEEGSLPDRLENRWYDMLELDDQIETDEKVLRALEESQKEVAAPAGRLSEELV